ncbi:hypothetical protein [Liquorilactobacillus satsumensis]|uniref:hypothetical protein n=1 Tax=Liquorilactobacillus satsumensis TaxID=259059 RepID=UPI0039E7F4D4
MNYSVIEEVHAVSFVLLPLIDDFFQLAEVREFNHLINECTQKNLLEIPNEQIALAYSIDDALQRFNIPMEKKVEFHHLLETRICSFISCNKNC